MKIISVVQALLFWKFLWITSIAGSQITISSFEQLLMMTEEQSRTLADNGLKFKQSVNSKYAAIGSILDLNGNIYLNSTNNTRLPVSLFPAELFGGEPGSFRQIQTGTKYTNNFGQYAELKLVNLPGWYNLKLSKINIELTDVENKLIKKNLYDNIAVVYFTIVMLNQQLTCSKNKTSAADSIYETVRNKYESGLARAQNLNDSRVNYLASKNSENQLFHSLNQQYSALKILCDFPDSIEVIINESISESVLDSQQTVNKNKLSYQVSKLRAESLRMSLIQSKSITLPYLSAIASNSNQQFSNTFSLFDRGTSWINSNYVGIKAVWVIPSSNSLSAISKYKYDYLMALNNIQNEDLKSALENEQLAADYRNALSSYAITKEILDLRNSSYLLNFENYKQGIISLEDLLTSYNLMATSEYENIASITNIALLFSKIKINNQAL